MAIFNFEDGQTVNGIWKRNAYYFEGSSFDKCNAHPAGTKYHVHATPVCLFNDNDSSKHSPIIGFAFDGYPIYGSFGFSNPQNKSSPIKRIIPSFRLRSITQRTSLANGTVVSAANYGPAINASYPLGSLLDDYEYVAGYGDLDSSNGRYGVTPEYPEGTYAYFMTYDNNGKPAFPYTLGYTYYGCAITLNTISGKITPNETTKVLYQYSNVASSTVSTTANMHVLNFGVFNKQSYFSHILLSLVLLVFKILFI